MRGEFDDDMRREADAEGSGQVNYAMAKAGVTGLSKAIAKEWGPQFGVRCNT